MSGIFRRNQLAFVRKNSSELKPQLHATKKELDLDSEGDDKDLEYHPKLRVS